MRVYSFNIQYAICKDDARTRPWSGFCGMQTTGPDRVGIERQDSRVLVDCTSRKRWRDNHPRGGGRTPTKQLVFPRPCYWILRPHARGGSAALKPRVKGWPRTTMVTILLMGLWFRNGLGRKGCGRCSFVSVAVVFVSGGMTAALVAAGARWVDDSNASRSARSSSGCSSSPSRRGGTGLRRGDRALQSLAFGEWSRLWAAERESRAKVGTWNA
jgi:hypothetical protein